MQQQLSQSILNHRLVVKHKIDVYIWAPEWGASLFAMSVCRKSLSPSLSLSKRARTVKDPDDYYPDIR